MADGGLRIEAEGSKDEIDAVLLESDRCRVLALHRDVGAAAVGLIHGGERGGIGIDAKISHVERA